MPNESLHAIALQAAEIYQAAGEFESVDLERLRRSLEAEYGDLKRLYAACYGLAVVMVYCQEAHQDQEGARALHALILSTGPMFEEFRSAKQDDKGRSARARLSQFAALDRVLELRAARLDLDPPAGTIRGSALMRSPQRRSGSK